MSRGEAEVVWPPQHDEVPKFPKKWMRNRQIMIEIMDEGRSYREVAKRYGISTVRVSQIVTRPRTWEPPALHAPKEVQRKEIRKLPSGRYLVDFKVNGTTRCRSVGTKAEAEALLAEWAS